MIPRNPEYFRPKPKIVGPASPKEKEAMQQKILERFSEGHYKQFPEKERKILEAVEYIKRPYEISAIREANRITNRLLKKFRLPPFIILERNIHIIPEDSFQKIEKSGRIAITVHDQQAIFLNTEKLFDPIFRLSVILHEIFHLKGALIIEAHKDLDKPYQIGLKICATLKKEKEIGFFTSFRGLNEAVVSEMEKNIHQNFFKNFFRRINF